MNTKNYRHIMRYCIAGYIGFCTGMVVMERKASEALKEVEVKLRELAQHLMDLDTKQEGDELFLDTLTNRPFRSARDKLLTLQTTPTNVSCVAK